MTTVIGAAFNIVQGIAQIRSLKGFLAQHPQALHILAFPCVVITNVFAFRPRLIINYQNFHRIHPVDGALPHLVYTVPLPRMTSTNGQGLSFVHTPSSQSNTYQSYASLEEACTRTVINVFCRLMALPLTGSGNTPKGSVNVSVAEGIDSDAALTKTKACFTLRESLFFF